MNFASLFSLLPMLMTVLGDLPKAIQALSVLPKLILDAESTTLAGPDKMTAVLNDFETALDAINPEWGGEFDPIAKGVEAVVNDIVAAGNIFKKAAPAPAA